MAVLKAAAGNAPAPPQRSQPPNASSRRRLAAVAPLSTLSLSRRACALLGGLTASAHAAQASGAVLGRPVKRPPRRLELLCESALCWLGEQASASVAPSLLAALGECHQSAERGARQSSTRRTAGAMQGPGCGAGPRTQAAA